MNKREAAIVSAYTGYLIGKFGDFHEYAEEKMGRPILTFEFASEDFASDLHDASREDFINIKLTEHVYSNADLPKIPTTKVKWRGW